MRTNIDQLLNCTPSFNGRLRKESWGGIYMLRNSLTIDVVNEIAYDILSKCDGRHTVNDIIGQMQEEYDSDEQTIYNDVINYIGFALNRRIVKDEGFDINQFKALNGQDEAAVTVQKRFEEYGLNFNVQSREKPPFFKGKGILGLEPNVLSAPLNVLIEFTHNCNLKCIHCFADADCNVTPQGYLEGELSAADWIKVIDNLADAGVFEVFVSGGEAMMRKDIFKIMERITERFGGFCLLSNMTYIDHEAAQKLKELGCYKVEGNLDGYDAATYDEFRGVKGSFEKTVKGIQACLENGIPVRCNVTATKKNIYNLKKIIKTAYEIGVRELVAIPLEPGGRARSNWDEINIPIEEGARLEKFYREVKEWANQEYGDEFFLVVPTSTFMRDEDDKVMQIMDPNRILPFCGAGKFHCSINPHGNVILCPAAGSSIEITPGDCLNMDFKEVWVQADAFRKIRSYDLPCYESCEFQNCTGGCHVRAFQKYGEVVGSPGEDCRKVQMKKLGKTV
ncbi:radical SAM protein [Alkaliphilus crotonatoxidans]